MYQERVKKYYDYTLNLYKLFWHGDTYAVHYGIWDESTKSLHDALLNANKFLADRTDIKSGEKALDAGCGVGGSAFWLAKKRGAYVVGITISQKKYYPTEYLLQKNRYQRVLKSFN
jgi:cyclopropane fatty-acyl-phospholipid synthase-like methyltransferase|tara:strand:+ start:797 stop:1144 length:348 start_codon:yes stop_codon:yes gene_type:complete